MSPASTPSNACDVIDTAHADIPAVVISVNGPKLVLGGGAGELRRCIEKCLATGHHDIIVDLKQVQFIDSSGIDALVVGLVRSRKLGGQFKLLNPTPRIVRVLGITRLDTVFEIERD